MNTASPMSMPMMSAPGTMSAMPMPVPMMMPMSCHMSCSMTEQGMKCMMMPAEGVSMDMMKDMCATLNVMMKNGTPCMMMCAGMPMMSCCGMPMCPAMSCEMTAKGMSCTMKPTGMMGMDMLKMCCDMMTNMMSCGMPMTLMCGSTPMMVCTR